LNSSPSDSLEYRPSELTKFGYYCNNRLNSEVSPCYGRFSLRDSDLRFLGGFRFMHELTSYQTLKIDFSCIRLLWPIGALRPQRHKLSRIHKTQLLKSLFPICSLCFAVEIRRGGFLSIFIASLENLDVTACQDKALIFCPINLKLTEVVQWGFYFCRLISHRPFPNFFPSQHTLKLALPVSFTWFSNASHDYVSWFQCCAYSQAPCPFLCCRFSGTLSLTP
jgi:hypothetical protein